MNLAEIDDDDDLKDMKLKMLKLYPENLKQFSLDPGEVVECIS